MPTTRTITRTAWGKLHTSCMVCGRTPRDYEPPLATHEIIRGVHRAKALKLPAAWLRVCVRCHEDLDGMPIAKQLAIKLLRDPSCYDRVAVNICRCRAADSVSEAEVVAEFAKLQAASN